MRTHRSELPVSKSRWTVVLPTVTGLRYAESYSSLGAAGTDPLAAAAATTVLLALFCAASMRL
jgi:hypothetical protein